MSGELKKQNTLGGITHTSASHAMSKSQGPTPSPLKIFGNAKKRIRDIFVDISKYIEETKTFASGVEDSSLLSPAEKVKIGDYTNKVDGISNVLQRDQMKVVFFGRTSNGKSTCINSMLRTKILPSGIGHTTNCFVQVEGCDSEDGYVLLEGSEEKKSVNSLTELANALSKVKLPENALIRICWPKNKCHMLKDDVVLVDSPGVDVTPDLDTWIDKFCLDADVFVLVANAESTLMQTEKNFFLKVSDRLSKPTVFILNNRWDASASEPEMMEMVRSQHMERNTQFLCNELKVVTKQEAEERIFFVSAKETLQQRLTESGASTTPGPFLDGYQTRLFEFSNFERKFEECLSRSAVKTKFAQHAKKGKQMMGEMKEIMDALMDKCHSIRDQKMRERTASNTQLADLDRRLADVTAENNKLMQSISEDVQMKVARALSEEIRRLYELVDEFDRPFHPDPMFVDVYKKELHKHVESGLGRKIQERCSSALDDIVLHTEQRMADKLLSMLPEERKNASISYLKAKPIFTIEYRLDAKNLCTDFREDIQFRFSYSPSALLSRYMGRNMSFTLFNRPSFEDRRVTSSIPAPFPRGPTTDSAAPNYSASFQRMSSQSSVGVVPSQEDDLSVALLRLAPALASTSTIACVVAAGVITKAVGWRVFAFVGGCYGLLYVYERLMWSNKAKERAFKSQYVTFAGSKLRLIVDMTSANASHQVHQELSSTFSKLRHEVVQARQELEQGIRVMDIDLRKVDETASQAKLSRNKAGWLDNELNDFISRFIDYA